MGKIRVKTIGDEEQEKVDVKKAQARAEAKKAREEAEARKAAENDNAKDVAKPQDAQAEQKVEEPAKKKVIVKKSLEKKQNHSENYQSVAQKVDKNKQYDLNEALQLLPQLQRAKFDETVELHINTHERGISGNVTLPHGTGKETRITIANAAVDPKAVDELVKKIESGTIDFDILIATPDTMPKLAKVARVLGPRGLMPNPKNGTVTPKPDEIAKKYSGGQINFKTEAKHPLMHIAVGKVSFGEKKLADNIKSAISAVKTKNIKKVTIASTMSPGLHINTASL